MHPAGPIRVLAYIANAVYFVALLAAAINIYDAGHREPDPTSPLDDWAALDALFSSFLAGGVVIYDIVYAIGVLLWRQLGQIGPLLVATIPLSVFLPLVWLAYGRTDMPGWQVVLAGLVAAGTSWVARGDTSVDRTPKPS